MKIGIFGGSFDPIHKGHVALALRAQKTLNLDRIIFVPARQSPFKAAASAAAAHRVQMLKLALAAHSSWKISHYEIRHPGLSYTYKTLEYFRKRWPRAELYFLMGSDAFAHFKRWKHAARILKCATLAVADRQGEPRKCSSAEKNKIVFLEGKLPRAASSAIRSGQRFKKAQLLPSVYRYIQKRHLYETDPA